MMHNRLRFVVSSQVGPALSRSARAALIARRPQYADAKALLQRSFDARDVRFFGGAFVADRATAAVAAAR